MIKQIQTVEEYQPVPVKAAKEIAEKYDKAIVIINTWDTKHGLLHTTTYGVSQEQKHQAAKGGDISAKALGADMPRSNFYEDFRKNELAQAQQEAVSAERERIIIELKRVANIGMDAACELETVTIPKLESLQKGSHD